MYKRYKLNFKLVCKKSGVSTWRWSSGQRVRLENDAFGSEMMPASTIIYDAMMHKLLQ